MKLVKSQFDWWQKSKLLLILFLFIMSTISLNAVWKWERFPDPNGVDIKFFYPDTLADDWLCSSTGPIRNICIYNSWFNDDEGIIDSLLIQIWSDVADPDGQGPLFSHPGNLLWSDWFIPKHSWYFGSGVQAWYDPWTQEYIPANHLDYYRTQIIIPDSLAFIQTSGTIYWISVSVAIQDTINTRIGWKTTNNPWNDKATYFMHGAWHIFPDIPPVIQDLAFKLGDDVDDECPVELSSFSGTYASGLCQINWVTESETNVQGFNIYRNTDKLVNTATKVNGGMISATNTSQTTEYHFQDLDVASNQAYYYWLESNDYDGSSNLYGPININTLSENVPVAVTVTSLSSVYPNPARSVNPVVNASIKSGETGVLSIYNLKGQLVNSYNLQSGTHRIEWNRTDSKNNKCAEGMYFYRLVTPSLNQTRKILILK